MNIILITDLMSTITLRKFSIASIGKESFESILILAKLWLILSVIPRSLLIWYLTLSQFSSQ